MKLNSTKRTLGLALLAGMALLLYPAPLKSADVKAGALEGKIELSSNAGAENTLIYLEGVAGSYPPPSQPAVMDQKGKVFIPHLLPIQKGQSVRFANSDLFSHNIHAYWGRKSMFNVVQGIDGRHGWTPPRSDEYLVLCDIHREMSAFVFVFEHPFFAAVDQQGTSGQFRIEAIPAGTYTLVAVRDVRKRLVRQKQQVVIEAGKTTTVTVRF